MVLHQMSLFCRYGLHQTSTKQTRRNGMFVLLWPASVCVSSVHIVPPIIQVYLCLLHISQPHETQGTPSCLLTTVCESSFTLGENSRLSLKPLCSINHRPCLHTLPIRKVRAPFHRIIQLHQKRFVLLVNVLDTSNEK